MSIAAVRVLFLGTIIDKIPAGAAAQPALYVSRVYTLISSLYRSAYSGSTDTHRLRDVTYHDYENTDRLGIEVMVSVAPTYRGSGDHPSVGHYISILPS